MKKNIPNGRQKAVPMKSNTIPTPTATEAEREMYQRYVRYFDSGTSPYSGPAPLPFFMWLKLKPQYRPGGPTLPDAGQTPKRQHMTWQAGDITWATEREPDAHGH